MLKKLQASVLAALLVFLVVSTGRTQQLAGGPIPKPPTLCVNSVCPSSAPGPVSPTPPPPVTPQPSPSPSGAAVKWHPGTYVWTAGIPWAGAQDVVNGITAICSNANITGVQVVLKWSILEGATAGDYSGGFAAVDAMLAKARSCNKRVMVQIAERIFGTPTYTQSVGQLSASFPAYLLTSNYGVCCGVLDATGTELSFGGVVGSTANSDFYGEQAIARLWDPAVMDRLIALSNAYAARYDGNPYFEMLSIGESAVPPFPSFWPTGYNTQVMRFHSSVAQAWPHTLNRMNLNFTLGDSTMKDFFELCLSLKNCVVGGPDPEIPLPNITRQIQANEIFRGAQCSGCTARDYRGALAWVGEQEWLGLEYTPEPTNLLTGYQKDTMHDSFMIWPDNSPRWPDVLAQINTDNSVATVSCPSNFVGCTTD
jgi:hypothetical protein